MVHGIIKRRGATAPAPALKTTIGKKANGFVTKPYVAVDLLKQSVRFWTSIPERVILRVSTARRFSMLRLSMFFAVLIMLLSVGARGYAAPPDVIPTSGGDLKITRVGHASVMFEFGGKIIHVDPFGKMGDYAKLPKADLILLTHEHMDHLDPEALSKIRTAKTVVVLTDPCANKVKGGVVMRNGDVKELLGLKIEAVPMYNIVGKRDTGEPFHPKGRGNGYVITFGDKRVYVAGDTENIPEMKNLKNIDVAFLPVNQPYTMTAAMAADAAKAFKPKILYPYHHDMAQTDVAKLPELMKGVEGIEIRMKKK